MGCRRRESLGPRPVALGRRVSPPYRSLDGANITLESAGFIRRQPGIACSIEMLVDPDLYRQRDANQAAGMVGVAACTLCAVSPAAN